MSGALRAGRPGGGHCCCADAAEPRAEVDALNNTMTVEAGCILQNLQDVGAPTGCSAVAGALRAPIGGNLSTNAGGVAVLRYGNARAVPGPEVVTAGRNLERPAALRKDNTGYDPGSFRSALKARWRHHRGDGEIVPVAGGGDSVMPCPRCIMRMQLLERAQNTLGRPAHRV